MFGENTIIGKIAKGEIPTKEVKNNVGRFVLQYPTGTDWKNIALKQSLALRGQTLESFEKAHLYIVKRDASLSIAIKEYPKDFPVCFQGDGICDFPNEEVKDSLFGEFNTFYIETQRAISGKPKQGNGDKELELTG